MSFGTRDTEKAVSAFGSLYRKLVPVFLTSTSFQVHVFPMNLNRVPGRSTKVQFLVLIVERYITCGIETNYTGIDKRTSKRVIDEIVIRRIFIDAAAVRAINTRVSVIMPDLSCLK